MLHRSRLLVVLCGLAVVAWGRMPAAAAAQTVSPDASGGQTLSTCDAKHLTSAVTAGGMITVACTGPITISSVITISAAHPTTIDASGDPLTIMGSTTTPNQIFNVEKGSLTLVAISISSAGTTGATGNKGQNGTPGANGDHSADGSNGSDGSGCGDNGGTADPGQVGTGSDDGGKGHMSNKGSDGEGGAIYVATGTSLTVIGGTFSGNQAKGGAGGKAGNGGNAGGAGWGSGGGDGGQLCLQ
jgi:hypothetical protein